MVYGKHVIVNSSGVRECLRCWACTCHCAEELASPCRGFERITDRVKKDK